MRIHTLLSTCFTVVLAGSAGAVTIGFGTGLNGVQDTQSNGNNQMRQNINITNTVVLQPGTYQATSWD
ncbi:MAG: hypothetical protein VYA27_05315, partial [Verrucomicrobiota bacterium]|nr:hypothetical protein [Verrucomicrobiota bacterium]